MSLITSSITSSFGHDFYPHTANNQPLSNLVQSPIKKTRAPSAGQIIFPCNNENKITKYKKTKYAQKNGYNQHTYDKKITKVTPFYNVLNSDDFINNFDSDLREQAKLITHSAPFLNFSGEKKQHIRSLILAISENALFDKEAKCAELGILYFYMTSKEILPASNFVAHRTRELITEAKELKRLHKENCPLDLQSQFPSGTRAYLLLAFVRMIFTSDGGFNPGGCKALKMMMQGRLQLQIAEEMRMQVVRIADRLLADQSFVELFKDSFEIHEDLKELIAIDLHLLKDEPLNLIYLRWDLLIALISPLSQLEDDGNCFTIAPAANFLVNSPDTVIKMLTEVLKTGKLEFENTDFPVSTLLEGARANEAEFLNSVSVKDIYHLTPFFMLRDCLNIRESRRKSSEKISLDSSMELQFKDNAEYAKQLYLSLKQNLLQKLLVAIIQFAAINIQTDPKMELIGTDRSAKDRFTNNVIQRILVFLRKEKNVDTENNPDLKRYLEKLRMALSESFYLVDYKNWDMKIDDGFVSFEFHEKGLLLNYEMEEYDCFLQQRRLFFRENEELVPIDSITKFKEYLGKIVSRVEQQARTRNYDLENRHVCAFMQWENFEESISKMIVKLNKSEIALEADSYHDSDSFIIAQNGSTTNFLEVWNPLSSRLNPVSIKAKNVSSFFYQLCKLFSNCAKGSSFLNDMDPWILVEESSHVYNFYPFRFKEHWNGKTFTKDHRRALESITVDRVEQNQTFTAEKKERILDEIIECASTRSISRLIHSSCNTQDFAREVKKVLPANLHSKLNDTINRIMNEIDVADIKEYLTAILSYAGEQAAKEPYCTEILAKIQDGFEIYPYITPYQLAKIIHKVLLSEGYPITVSRDGLEKHIREIAHMPEIIDIGNLNWTSTLEEKPDYYYLSIKYDFVYGLVFCERKKGKERILDEVTTNNILSSTVMYLPK